MKLTNSEAKTVVCALIELHTPIEEEFDKAMAAIDEGALIEAAALEKLKTTATLLQEHLTITRKIFEDLENDDAKEELLEEHAINVKALEESMTTINNLKLYCDHDQEQEEDGSVPDSAKSSENPSVEQVNA